MRDAGCVDVLQDCLQAVEHSSGVTLCISHERLDSLGADASRIPHLASRLLDRTADNSA